MTSRIRIGIDVGGTFTHAVAVDGGTHKVLGHSVVPTTHCATEGVAAGIVESLHKLLRNPAIKPSDVKFIAHSTTQATNALLEGDLAKVGIIDGSKTGIDDLVKNGAQALVAAGAFSVDDPAWEKNIIDQARAKGIPACGTHEISGLYGLKARTRTSVVNASVLPKMLEAADMTEKAVKDSGITAKLMVMRNDGGVIDMAGVRKRPIQTILSGPAAGVAAALMYECVSDGIFIEVGGTSTDITVIRNGRALVRSARVGGRRLYLKTLDVRTLGLAGGSMPRMSGDKISGVGPRSAHIAGLPYSCFSEGAGIRDSKVVSFSPKPGDPSDYVCLEAPDGSRYAITVTCAANALGLIPDGDYAKGRNGSVHPDVKRLAKDILDVSSEAFVSTIEGLIKEYKLDRTGLVLIGGGGGASTIVPCVADKMKLDYKIAENNAILSAIGVAIALLHETVERSVIEPSEEDILRIRREAEEKLLRMGAVEDSIDVHVEVDLKKNVVTASAFGATEMKKQGGPGEVNAGRRRDIASRSMKVEKDNVKLLAETPGLSVFEGEIRDSHLFGLIRKSRKAVRVVDRRGVIRLQCTDAMLKRSTGEKFREDLNSLLDGQLRYGDAGAETPKVFVMHGSRILDLSDLTEKEHIIALAALELKQMPKTEPVVILSGRR